ncbi:hypothetical protein SAMN06295974_1888 [Plantibacter flavus]|uniref:Uncharacterized protein n=1 Tax=Plantibacter flavus TaxID=150123 RepID=A0A3N2BY22_9MICO|nr:hypothetical protein [Plantibacter flavus]ROR79994.1 hypothetical protein EDD42_0025 [Plantibacter flavus]SMG28285.1 hypothetical protein SAMN06295974_1888 [Plantibacter flavus]
MLLTFLLTIENLLPLEVALTFGFALFALSWLYPRRILSVPQVERRRSTLLWVGVVGPLLVVVAATVASALAASTWDWSGYDGWWRRPLPLLVAAVVVAAAGFTLGRSPQPKPTDRAVAPQRSWSAFAPQRLLVVAAACAAVIVIVAGWQVSIAVSAPADGPFFGQVPHYTTLPIYMSFNGFGYVPGAGWPNHAATFLVLGIAAAMLVVTLRADANRALPVRSAAPTATVDRKAAARLLTLILLAGLVATLGAVLMHVGTSGLSTVGLDEEWVSENVSITKLSITGGYRAIAEPLNLTGYALQGAGVALALRIAADTLRSRRRIARTAATDTAGMLR